MNGFEKHGLDEDAFGDKKGMLKSFDAFPKTKPTYTSATARGGQWTVVVVIFCLGLTFTELTRWWIGTETHHFSVERGVGHELQMNLDIVVKMPCADLDVNVQDAAMDRILAGHFLSRDDTNWDVWTKRNPSNVKKYNTLHDNDLKRRKAEEQDAHVAHIIGHMREGGRKFARTPNMKRGEPANACRIYGSLEGNKVQGDFHITARGHGYMEMDPSHHLDHTRFNFSHYVNELSFGPHYPNLLNPLDRTSDATEFNFMKYQYFLSIVPTIYTKRRVSTNDGILDPGAVPQPPTLDLVPDIKTLKRDGTIQHKAMVKSDSHTVFTNQYAATSQSHQVPHNMPPGIFFKYDIEPILLIVNEQRGSFLALIVRLVNVISGVMVGGGWAFQLAEFGIEVWNTRKARRTEMGHGVIHGGSLGH